MHVFYVFMSGFGAMDDWSYWSRIHIPSVFVNKRNGERLKNLLNISKVNIPQFGVS